MNYSFQTSLARRFALLWLVIGLVLTGSSGLSVDSASAQESQPIPQLPGEVVSTLYLPAVQRPAPPPVPPLTDVRRVNAPYFQDQIRFNQAAIFWFGEVSQTNNYTDVRVGYTQSEIVFRMAIFDRLLWFDSSPTASDLLNWDSASLLIELSGSAQALTSTAYRFDAQLNGSGDRTQYEVSYRGNSGTWTAADVNFTTTDGYRGGGFNNYVDNRGWIVEYHIPFSGLGLAGAPADGEIWQLGLVVHDRDDAVGSALTQKSWPEQLNITQPRTWGELHFGLPAYTPPGVPNAGTITLRNGLNGVTVRDAAVGGTTGNLCPGDPTYIWNGWGDDTFGGAVDFNIQNQADLADWPCFAKYYVSFPLQDIPNGKVITSAQLTLYLFGNSDPDLAEDSYIQVFSLAEDFNDASLSWNNAPLALENVAQTWIAPSGPPWPYIPYTWDVTLSVAQAYHSGMPANLALYSADGAQHSGKYFVSSEFGDWPLGRTYRPTLVVTWGNP